MTDAALLSELHVYLRRLVDILRLDENCQWTRKFEGNLADCENLLEKSASRDEMVDLASSVTFAMVGAGSFEDYGPDIYDPSTGRYTQRPGTEDW